MTVGGLSVRQPPSQIGSPDLFEKNEPTAPRTHCVVGAVFSCALSMAQNTSFQLPRGTCEISLKPKSSFARHRTQQATRAGFAAAGRKYAGRILEGRSTIHMATRRSFPAWPVRNETRHVSSELPALPRQSLFPILSATVRQSSGPVENRPHASIASCSGCE